MMVIRNRRIRFPAVPAAALLMAMLLAAAGARAQSVDYAKSQIGFAARQMSIPVDGKFTRFTAAVAWNPAKPEAGHAEIAIDLNSFDIGLDEVNQELKGSEWFDVKSSPQAKFASGTVKALGGGKFEAGGKLSIKGRTRDVVASFTVKTEGANHVFEGVVPLKRLQFGIGEGSWSDTATVADEVQVKFKIVAGAAPAAGQRK